MIKRKILNHSPDREWTYSFGEKMEVKLSNPRTIAKQIMRDRIPEVLRIENEVFFAALLQEIKNHPLSLNPAIVALN